VPSEVVGEDLRLALESIDDAVPDAAIEGE
jgi:hypothetical protein